MLDKNMCKEYVCDCEQPTVINNGREFVCSVCGIVLEKVFLSKERRYFDKGESDKRKHHEMPYRKFGPRTYFKLDERFDANGNKLPKHPDRIRMGKIQNSLLTSKERNQWASTPRFKQMMVSLNLPQHIIDEAKTIYEEAVNQKLIMGRTINGFIAASIYAVIRHHDLPYLYEEINEPLNIKRRTMHQSLYLLIQKVLPKFNIKYKPVSPKLLIFKISNQLNISQELQNKATKILEKVFKKGIKFAGKDPKGFASACIYLVCKAAGKPFKKTQVEIANAAKITEVTLRSRNFEIKKFIDI